MTLALGIDPGTASTGYGFVRLRPDGELEPGAYGVIATPAASQDPMRLLTLYRELKALIERHSPNAGAVEKIFFQRNVSTALGVGQARGVVMLAFAEAGIDLSEYTPNEVKQAVVGYGSAQKRQVQEMVKVLLRLPVLPRPDDAADALAVAITHLNTRKY